MVVVSGCGDRWGIGHDVCQRVDLLVGVTAWCGPHGVDDAEKSEALALAKGQHAIAARIRQELNRVERWTGLRGVWLTGVRVVAKAGGRWESPVGPSRRGKRVRGVENGV